MPFVDSAVWWLIMLWYRHPILICQIDLISDFLLPWIIDEVSNYRINLPGAEFNAPMWVEFEGNYTDLVTAWGEDIVFANPPKISDGGNQVQLSFCLDNTLTSDFQHWRIELII